MVIQRHPEQPANLPTPENLNVATAETPTVSEPVTAPSQAENPAIEIPVAHDLQPVIQNPTVPQAEAAILAPSVSLAKAEEMIDSTSINEVTDAEKLADEVASWQNDPETLEK